MDFIQELNPEQRKAVLHTDGPLLILAGAGSGKTRVITYRIAFLVGSAHCAPDEVLAVTFTNKAAEEMRERVERLLGPDSSPSWISTFHTFCARVLRREAPAIGLSRDFVIYDSSDQLAVVRQLMKELDVDDKLLPPRSALASISHAKNRMESMDSLRQGAWNYRGEQVARIYVRYIDVLRNANALDFDDLLLRTVDLFQESTAGAKYAARFRYVMVDEYQDTNRPQYLLIKHLAAAHRNLCVVGDPDQSIYRWRGADLKNILDFEDDFNDAHVVRLEQNYRSTQVILDAASAVIQQNTNRKEKRLWTDMRGGDKITYLRANDEIEEADFIARTARRALTDDHEGLFAVLYRTNAQSRAIEDALMREGVSYKIIGGVRFYERKEIKDALAYMKLMINPDDDVSFRRVINVPPRGIGKGVIEALDALPVTPPDAAPLLAAGGLMHDGRTSLWSRVERGVDDGLLSGRALSPVRGVRELLRDLSSIAKQESVSIAIGKMLDRTGYINFLREDHSEESESRLENLQELVSAAKDYEQREPDPSLRGFVDRLSLLSEADEEQGSREARTWLMTMHAAKGLEFRTVVIAGMEEGLFPHARVTAEGDDIEEERRLCYVAMTRARSRLVLTAAARRRVFGDYQGTQPSRFLEEVPPQLMEVVRQPSEGYRFTSPHYEFRTNPYARGGRRGGRVREDAESLPAYAYENEDQSRDRAELRPGARVKHPEFGFGTVVDVETYQDDYKVTVKFGSTQKKLIAKFARLQLV